MYAVRKLVQALIGYIDTGDMTFRPGILRDERGEPILDISSLSGPNSQDSMRTTSEMLLDLCAKGDFIRLDGVINTQGKLDYSLFSYTDGTAIMVPCISEVDQVPFGVIALARMADTGSGDSVAHRIAQCEWCGKFFIRRTKKKSRFDNRQCRIKHMNKERLKSGYFRNYYINRRLRERG